MRHVQCGCKLGQYERRLEDEDLSWVADVSHFTAMVGLTSPPGTMSRLNAWRISKRIDQCRPLSFARSPLAGQCALLFEFVFALVDVLHCAGFAITPIRVSCRYAVCVNISSIFHSFKACSAFVYRCDIRQSSSSIIAHLLLFRRCFPPVYTRAMGLKTSERYVVVVGILFLSTVSFLSLYLLPSSGTEDLISGEHIVPHVRDMEARFVVSSWLLVSMALKMCCFRRLMQEHQAAELRKKVEEAGIVAPPIPKPEIAAGDDSEARRVTVKQVANFFLLLFYLMVDFTLYGGVTLSSSANLFSE